MARGRPRKHLLDGDPLLQELGRVPDQTVADALSARAGYDVSKETVRRRRLELGIPASRAYKRRTPPSSGGRATARAERAPARAEDGPPALPAVPAPTSVPLDDVSQTKVGAIVALAKGAGMTHAEVRAALAEVGIRAQTPAFATIWRDPSEAVEETVLATYAAMAREVAMDVPHVRA